MSERNELIHDADLWAIESDFWLGGVESYERRVAPEAVLMLPGPKATLTRSQTIEVIRNSPRWNEIAFESTQTIRPTLNVALLAYEAIGHCDGAQRAYRARCSSLYVEREGRWELILHQQTPW